MDINREKSTKVYSGRFNPTLVPKGIEVSVLYEGSGAIHSRKYIGITKEGEKDRALLVSGEGDLKAPEYEMLIKPDLSSFHITNCSKDSIEYKKDDMKHGSSRGKIGPKETEQFYLNEEDEVILRKEGSELFLLVELALEDPHL